MAAGAEFFYQIRSMTMNAISRPPNIIAMILGLTDVPICHVFVEPREGLGRASPRALTSGALLEHHMMNDSPIVFAELVGSPLLTGDPESIIGHAVHSTHCWCAAGCWSPTLPTKSTKPASADGSCAAMRTDRPAA
jgi:hypothetical protein